MVILSDLSPTSDVTFTDNEAIGTILANDDATGIVTISLVTDATASEENTGRINFKVKSEFTAISPFTFGYEVDLDNSSADTDDFDGATNGTAIIPAGKDSTTISISIATDDTIEPDETFRLLLTNPSANVNLEQTSAVGKILNDDLGEISDATATIGDGEITLNWTNPNSNIFAGAVIAQADSTTAAPDHCSGGRPLGNVTSDTITLATGSTYSFRICAKSTTDRLSGGFPLPNLIPQPTVDNNGNGLIEIATATQLNNIRHNLAGTGYKTSSDAPNFTRGCPNNACNGYELTASIDLNSFTNWNPIGTNGDTNAFTGIFEGNGHTIRNLVIHKPTVNFVGLFGGTNGATLRNVKIYAGNITGGTNVGALVGRVDGGSIRNCAAINPSSSLTGGSFTGGLVGNIQNSSVMNSYATGSVSSIGSSGVRAGGLVGNMHNGSVMNSYATGSVSSASDTPVAGGLVGYMQRDSSIINSYATGSATAAGDFSESGGLVGLCVK